ncbi:MAG: LacI family DNA-binding transcriptional regulator [Planctomycetes bacterium]|nr:LacI family DNA-binding transcriptional regulator [Planctomycetota bacterium]
MDSSTPASAQPPRAVVRPASGMVAASNGSAPVIVTTDIGTPRPLSTRSVSPKPPRASIRDVARESGVSLTTVSLVLNKNDSRISAATRQRVLDAMERLAYTPSRLARGLPNRRAKTLAVLVPALQHAFADVYFGEIISGIYEAAAERDFHIVLEVARREYVRRKEYMTLLDDCSVDGILFIGATEEHRWLSEFDGSTKPMVVVNNHFRQWKLHSVVCDYPSAGRMAADTLIEMGHKRIGHISGPSDMVLTSQELTDSFLERLGDHGVRLDQRHIVDGQFLVETGRLACDELLKRDPRLSAVFCANDKMALGAYQSVRAAGLVPGKDVSIMGCDDIPTAALSDPPLTTIRMNFFEVGAAACRRMLEMIEDPARAADFTMQRIPVAMAIRGSCAAPVVRPAKK